MTACIACRMHIGDSCHINRLTDDVLGGQSDTFRALPAHLTRQAASVMVDFILVEYVYSSDVACSAYSCPISVLVLIVARFSLPLGYFRVRRRRLRVRALFYSARRDVHNIREKERDTNMASM